jgi:hypothetical protein
VIWHLVHRKRVATPWPFLVEPFVRQWTHSSASGSAAPLSFFFGEAMRNGLWELTSALLLYPHTTYSNGAMSALAAVGALLLLLPAAASDNLADCNFDEGLCAGWTPDAGLKPWLRCKSHRRGMIISLLATLWWRVGAIRAVCDTN